MLHSGEKKTWQRFSRLLDRRPSLKDFEKLMSNLFCNVDTIMNLGRILSRQLDWYLVSYQLHPSPRPNRILKNWQFQPNMSGDPHKLQNCCPSFKEFCSIPLQKIVTFISLSLWATSNLRCACCMNNDNFWKKNGGWTTEVRSKTDPTRWGIDDQAKLGGGFNHFLSSPLPGEMIKFA